MESRAIHRICFSKHGYLRVIVFVPEIRRHVCTASLPRVADPEVQIRIFVTVPASHTSLR